MGHFPVAQDPLMAYTLRINKHTKGTNEMTNVEKIYSSMSSAKRGAERAKIANPVFTKRADGKIALSEAIVKAATNKRRTSASNVESPVTIFRALFAEKYGKLKRSEIIAAAVERGIGKNTAATYYQKLSSAK